MAVPFSNTTLRVPHGFQALLEGMVKDILQTQPTDIYSYSAMYFENLLKLREGGSVDPAAKLAAVEDRTYNNKAFKTPDDQHNTEAEQDAAVVIQTKYRQYEAKSLADDLRQQNAATKIQAGVRGYMTRQQVRALRANQSPRVFEKGAVDEEDKELRDTEEEEADEPQDTGRDREFEDNEEKVGTDEAQPEEKDAGDYNDEPAEVTEDAIGESDEPVVSDESVAPGAAVEGDEAAAAGSTEGRESQLFTTNESVDERQSAATDIQAAYRGMKTRRDIKAIMDARAEDSGLTDEDARRLPEAAAQENGGEEETTRQHEFDLENSDEPGQLDDGRRDVKSRSSDVAEKQDYDEEPVPDEDNVTASGDGLEETADVEDTNQDELANAATALQAGFRGMKARQELGLLRNLGEADEIGNTEDQVDEEKPGNEEDWNVTDELAEQTDELGVIMADTARTSDNADPENMDAESEAAEKIEDSAEYTVAKETHLSVEDDANEGGAENADTAADEKDLNVEDNTNEEELEGAAPIEQETYLSGNLNEDELEEVIPGSHSTVEAETKQEEREEEATLVEEADLPAEENTDKEEIDRATSTIQAGFRGMQARKNMALLSESALADVNQQVGCDTQEEVEADELHQEDVGDDEDKPHQEDAVDDDEDKPHQEDAVGDDEDKPHQDDAVGGDEDKPHQEDDVGDDEDKPHQDDAVGGDEDKPHQEDDVGDDDEATAAEVTLDVEKAAVDEEVAEQEQLPEFDFEPNEPDNFDELPVAGDDQPLVDDDAKTGRSNENELLESARHPDDEEAQNEDVEDQENGEEGDD